MFIIASLVVMVNHGCIWFEQIGYCEGLLREGNILKHLYRNDYAEFTSKISYMMFSHDYHFVCEISTVRTLTLRLSFS